MVFVPNEIVTQYFIFKFSRGVSGHRSFRNACRRCRLWEYSDIIYKPCYAVPAWSDCAEKCRKMSGIVGFVLLEYLIVLCPCDIVIVENAKIAVVVCNMVVILIINCLMVLALVLMFSSFFSFSVEFQLLFCNSNCNLRCILNTIINFSAHNISYSTKRYDSKIYKFVIVPYFGILTFNGLWQ